MTDDLPRINTIPIKGMWLYTSHEHLPLLCSRQHLKVAKFQSVKNKASSKRFYINVVIQQSIPYTLQRGWNWYQLQTYIKKRELQKNITQNYCHAKNLQRTRG